MVCIASITSFQFHKVRLKDFYGIPDKLLLVFQFHKVRLKVSNTRAVPCAKMFQFHKVRLKVALVICTKQTE